MPGINPIIWPLVVKLHPMLSAQQRPRSTGWLPPPRRPVNRPWHRLSPQLRDGDVLSRTEPSVVHQLLPMQATRFTISGTTRDSAQAPLGNCIVDMFLSATDLKLDSTTSDANGLFTFFGAGQPPTAYYLVAYKAGAPDVAGTSLQTLTGA